MCVGEFGYESMPRLRTTCARRRQQDLLARMCKVIASTCAARRRASSCSTGSSATNLTLCSNSSELGLGGEDTGSPRSYFYMGRRLRCNLRVVSLEAPDRFNQSANRTILVGGISAGFSLCCSCVFVSGTINASPGQFSRWRSARLGGSYTYSILAARHQ